MSDTTNTAESGAGAVAPATNEAPQQGTDQAATTPEQQEADKAEAQRQEEEGRKKNRTREYIGKIQADNAELRRRLADLESRSQPRTQPHASPNPQQQTGDRRPTLEDHGYDFNAWQQADTEWVNQQAERRAAQLYDQRATQAREQETWQSYESKAAEFAGEHEDFFEVVGSMPVLPMELQAAIAAHPQGPAIAYHLGNNLSDLLQVAAVPPQLASYAVTQIAARLGAAPAASQHAAAPAVPAPNKPITQAPRPAPTVGGRAPASVDPERMTTEQWRDWREAQIKAKKG
jgi:hypothetical protein